MRLGRLELRSVQLERLLETLSGEVVREHVRQAERRRELRGVVARSEQPHLGRTLAAGVACTSYVPPLVNRTLAPSGETSERMSRMWSGNRSTSLVVPLCRSSCVITGSEPGARPMPRSMRPGASASSAANCSATTSGEWFGSMTPPDPTRMREVRAAAAATSTGGVVDATAGMLWCSANQ